MVFKDFSEHNATTVPQVPEAQLYTRFGKRALDIVVSLAVLPLILVVLIPAAIAIKLTSRGPVLFKQTRHGQHKSTFRIFKLRTMNVMEDGNAFRQAVRNDVRVTPVGRFLRRTSLDELPQIWNVLRGEMSLVGPRPMIVSQISEYGPNFTAYKRTRPGITGLWQTNGRNATTFTERARLDAWYVRNWSLWRDFVILVRTVREVICARGN